MHVDVTVIVTVIVMVTVVMVVMMNTQADFPCNPLNGEIITAMPFFSRPGRNGITQAAG
jgi:hypothetical protein